MSEVIKKKVGRPRKETVGNAVPTNKSLYDKIKERIYRENPKHSLFRSASIVKEYKAKGGKYKGEDTDNINKWFNDKWITVNDMYHDNKIVPCGNSNTEEKYSEYPLCRPLKIVNRLTKPQMKKLIDEKNKIKSDHLRTSKILNTNKYNVK